MEEEPLSERSSACFREGPLEKSLRKDPSSKRSKGYL
jgi:hypothetical protein